MTVVQIRRPARGPDKFRAYRIFVDGAERGRLDAGEMLGIEVQGAPHTLRAKVDWCGSPTVELPNDPEVHYEVGNAVRGFALFTVFFDPSNYLYLRRITPERVNEGG